MITLEAMYEEVPENQVIDNVVFKDGVAELPDNMRAKAVSICKFFNVKMVEEVEVEVEEVEEVEEEVEEFEDEDE